MALPLTLAAKRDIGTLTAALIQWADTFDLLIKRTAAITSAYPGAGQADFAALGVTDPATAQAYADLLTKFVAVQSAPAIVALANYANQLRDIGR